jgi:ketosteroid isomerase-like protein
MTRRFIMCLAMILAFCNSAFADPAAVVKAHSDAFGAAFTACDVPATLKLYEDNAVMIWPFEGEVATGKTEIEKLIKRECSVSTNESLVQISSDSRAIGKDYIINVGMWDDTVPGPDGKPKVTRIRTTELLHRSGGRWRYAIDNASIAAPARGKQ